MTKDGASFRSDHSPLDGGVAAIDVFGELDYFLVCDFEVELEQILLRHPEILIVDLSKTTFVCVAGYAAVGQCRLHVPRLVVCSADGFAEKVFRILGFLDVECVDFSTC